MKEVEQVENVNADIKENCSYSTASSCNFADLCELRGNLPLKIDAAFLDSLGTLLPTTESNKFLLLLNNFKRIITLFHELWKSVSIIDVSKDKGHTDGDVAFIVDGDNIDDALVICFYVAV